MSKLTVWAALAVALAGVAPAQNITGGGATFSFPMYSKWFDEYHKKFPAISINYQSQGSGFGIQQVTAGTVDFGATDGPMNDKQLAEFRAKRGFEVLHFPTVLGAAVPAYNLPGISQQLNFTPEALAGIFLGTVTKWNDGAIAGPNPGVKLPGDTIVVVHRSEGSGTTYIWSDYLGKVSKDWETKVGRGTSLNWPVGLGGRGNEGVAGQIKQTKFALGYVELTYALQTKMAYGKVKNAAGEFVNADLKTVSAAAAGAIKDIPDHFRASITNPPGKDSYPIASFTWLLIPSKIADGAKRKAMVDFLRWMLKEGQLMSDALSYAQLPKAVVDRELAAISKIQ